MFGGDPIYELQITLMRSTMHVNTAVALTQPNQASVEQNHLPSRRLQLAGKHAAIVCFSPYPADPRPSRAAEALVREGMNVDYVCLADGKNPARETANGVNVFRLPIRHRRGGKLAYIYQYLAFIVASSIILARRTLGRRYDLVYINNMPDVLVVSALIPKLFGAKVILDLHDPMPELMTTIFGLEEQAFSVRLIKYLERWSMARADLVITVNAACERIFASRSCSREKIQVIMNSPDEEIFPFAPVQRYAKRDLRQRFIVMYHGALVERNGVDVAVNAFAHLRERMPNAELRIYGAKSDFLERVLENGKRQGLHKAVRHFGPKRLEQIVDAIRECDLGVIPNQRNAFTDINTPTRIFEYLSLGKPVIAPRTQGITDYFNKESLLMFEPGNSEELARKIEHAYLHYDETLDIVERGQHVYLKNSWRRQRQALIGQAVRLLDLDSAP
jgi:glycosyltransferase involved in cell wall biosynthesis